ncbi:4-hydroxy-tetrahydrodipicolinate synthase [Bordetella genomosp. 10]|uniref:4-hydroxy-tetrahydrodipicolinate synthase n=1 Tax=Bordetella genomosp. 10 TaxID=1416804 RepID=A0A261SKM3_9BORD|nr:4-hydroxy-tetrahydrodipicolinate synthase [Bordetella genomosp. 10]OZI37978.1 4-hydroxy-tetrahydrodipicolinate synthase [Bordetella genomosp. 10]
MDAAVTALDGLWLPMVTPLREGRVDEEAAVRLARHYRRAGIAGLVLFGSTAEGNLLSLAERCDMAAALRADAEAGELPIMLGLGGVDTGGVAAAMRRLNRLDPVAYLVPPPYYLCPTQAGMQWHYRQLAWATDRPIMLYNVPRRTGSALTVASIEELAATQRIVGVKECDPTRLMAILRRGQVPAVCGEDTALCDFFLAGGQSAIAASAHVRPDLFVAMMRLARAGRAAEAQALDKQLKPLVRLLFSEPNPAPVKKALALAGLIQDELRLPMMPASGDLAGRLRRLLEKLSAAPADVRHQSTSAASVNI